MRYSEADCHDAVVADDGPVDMKNVFTILSIALRLQDELAMTQNILGQWVNALHANPSL